MSILEQEIRIIARKAAQAAKLAESQGWLAAADRIRTDAIDEIRVMRGGR